MESAPSELNRRPMQTHSLPQCGDGVEVALLHPFGFHQVPPA